MYSGKAITDEAGIFSNTKCNDTVMHYNTTSIKCMNYKQEAKMSERDRTMLCVNENLTVAQSHAKLHH